MDRKTKIRKTLVYLGKMLLAVMTFLSVLFTLAILTEIYTEFDKEHTLLGNLSHLFDVPRIGWRLLRDTLPGILAAGAAFFLASNFLASFYDLSNWRAGTDHIMRCVFGQRAFAPFVHVEGGRLNTEVSAEILTRIGGPGSALVYNDSAVVLEQGGRLTRVMEPGEFGFGLLEPFEKVHDVIDVRPTRWDYEVSALSKEGIPVTVSADVEFQIDTGGREPTDEKPYPALKEAIFKASTCRWMRAPESDEDDQYFDWARRVIISNTEGSLRGIIAHHRLDALIGMEGMPASSTGLPRKAIQEKLTRALQESCAKLGVQVNEVRLGTIKVADKVTEQWIEAWWNGWRDWTMVQERTGEARREQLREAAKAQAQVDMITAVARAFQQYVSRDARIPPQLLVMRLIEVFDRSRIGPHTYLPKEAIGTLKYLRELVIGEPVEPLQRGL